ncbi:hypothetical protein ApDm4_2044 [Acetobacter pomorum]|nr:hypothetical protein ApDm4_2044 [Acetobacter pomorum]
MESYPKMAIFCGLLAISSPFSAKANHPVIKHYQLAVLLS